MARIVKSRRRTSSGGKIAKRARRAESGAVVKVKKIYRAAKGVNVGKKDIIISVAAGGAGAIGAAFVLKKISAGTDATDKGAAYIAKNAAVAAVGGFMLYKGMKKKQWAIASAGAGMSAVAAANVITKFIPQTSTVSAPYINVPQLNAPIKLRSMAAPYKAAPRMVRVNDEDYV